MKALIFVNSLSLGGTEKAACTWAKSQARRMSVAPENAPQSLFVNSVSVLSLTDGPRRRDLERIGIPLRAWSSSRLPSASEVSDAIAKASVIHAHAPGFPHQGDVLGEALQLLGRKIPVVQTNIFGKLQNPKEDTWTDFRLFISWTSCVQAARRAGRKLDLDFFRRQSVAVYPVVDPLRGNSEYAMRNAEWPVAEGREEKAEIGNVKDEGGKQKNESEKLKVESAKLRKAIGLGPEHVLFGRFSRPEPNKWTPLVLDAFLAAHRVNPRLRLLLREPPAEVAEYLVRKKFGAWLQDFQLSASSLPVFLLSATSDSEDLAVSQMACDVILHTSSIGESFGYGLAEPMALGKPVITNSVPWHDQAQIELVRHGECGLIASTVPSMKSAILRMAENGYQFSDLRFQGAGSRVSRSLMGERARHHILSVADPEESTNRVEMAMRCAMEDANNPRAEEDLEKAIKTAEYLDKHQWGHSSGESLWLRGTDAKIHFLRWQRGVRNRLSG